MSKILDYVAQSNAYICQSACIAKVLGTTDDKGIRAALEAIGAPGSPDVMGQYLKSRVQSYQFLSAGSLMDAKDALDDGCVVITHGWFTSSGHVICLVGYEPDPKTYPTVLSLMIRGQNSASQQLNLSLTALAIMFAIPVMAFMLTALHLLTMNMPHSSMPRGNCCPPKRGHGYTSSRTNSAQLMHFSEGRSIGVHKPAIADYAQYSACLDTVA